MTGLTVLLSLGTVTRSVIRTGRRFRLSLLYLLAARNIKGRVITQGWPSCPRALTVPGRLR